MTLAQMDTGEAKTVIDEIINAQKTGVLTAATGETAPVRDIYPEVASRQAGANRCLGLSV